MENSLTDTDNFDYDRRSRISESKRKSISDESEVALHPTMAAAGLVFAARNDFQVWTTRIAMGSSSNDNAELKRARPKLNGGRMSDFSSGLSSPFVSILGEDKYRRVSQLTLHARQVSPSERCFFILLILVTFIYAAGIVTALVLLCFHMWIF